MHIILVRSLAALLLGACALPSPGSAQTTDAYRARQLFPVVVDTASFSQRFTFRAPGTVAIKFSYYPGVDTTMFAGGKIDCGNQSVTFTKAFASLREICPALAAGSQFGMLLAEQIDANPRGFAGFSRVSNPQGNGFSVEAFGVETFHGEYASLDAGGYTLQVDGLRRLAATAVSPAFQTNCFLGVAPGTKVAAQAVKVAVSVNGGGTLNLNLYPGQLQRLLDVFAATGGPAGDVTDARLRVVQTVEAAQQPFPVLAFCTVQDNTSFGADFRIGKGKPSGPLAERLTSEYREQPLPTGMTRRTFRIGTTANMNTHVAYFRHPDWVSCALRDPDTGLAINSGYDLEMRLLQDDATTVLAGGTGVTVFELYLGDKPTRYDGGNGRYLIEVQSGFPNANPRDYELRCESGSGHTRPDLVRYQLGDYRRW